ncbi:MAG: hypothetical protein E7666_07215 [Ruminococcaceae bacterium]|nr:hypothetical protein [Oscillospiraceae bacterium]
MNQRPVIRISQRAIAQGKYDGSRYNLLLVVIFSLINVVILATGADTYFLFSANIPYILLAFLQVIAIEVKIAAIAYVGIAIAIVLIIPYLVCWFFSKKHYAWLIGAALYFALDCIALVAWCIMAGAYTDMLFDFFFHAWVMYYLISGIRHGISLKRLPAEESTAGFVQTVEVEEEGAPLPSVDDSPILRRAGSEEKVKVYLETQYNGHTIIYRKYGKNTEELVIDNYVYAEYTFRGMAKQNTMNATVDGMQITAGCTQKNFIMVGNQIIAQSTRWL